MNDTDNPDYALELKKKHFNRVWTSTHDSQNRHVWPTVLCVCSAGLLRSPTAAWVLSNPPFNFNTRAAGYNDNYALIVVDDPLLEWANYVVCMDQEHLEHLRNRFPVRMATFEKEGKVLVLGMPDDFDYRSPELIRLMTPKLEEFFEK